MPDPLLQRALLESQLKLGPQGTVLRQLLSELAGGYSRTRKVNASNEVGIKAATQQARPDVSSAFDTALSSVSAQRAALGRSGDPQASAYERRVTEQRANALNDLTQREVRATEGRVYANQSARDEYLGGKAKIQGQLLDLAGQHGALTASTLAELKDEQRKAKLEDRRIDVSEGSAAETARHNRVQESAARRSAAKAKSGWLAPKDHANAKDQIDSAAQWIKNLSGGKMPSTQIRALLATGGTLVDDKGQEMKVPKIGKDYVNAAYDLVTHRGLSPANVRALHKRRLKIKDLGYPTARPRRKPKGGVSDALADLGRSVPRLNPVE